MNNNEKNKEIESDVETFYLIGFHVNVIFLLFLTKIIISLLEYELSEVRFLTYMGLLSSPVLIHMITKNKTFLREIYQNYHTLISIKVILIIMIILIKTCIELYNF